ncbi:hypothetical protein ACTMU2_41300 [Cupriavidus basilensis]
MPAPIRRMRRGGGVPPCWSIVLSATTATAAMAADADSYRVAATDHRGAVRGRQRQRRRGFERLIGQALTKTWNQPVIVENKPGAGTTTAPSTWHARTRMAIPCC